MTACASAPPAAPTPAGPTFEQKLAGILRLESERLLREPPPPAAPAPAPASGKAQPPAPLPPSPPDLLKLLTDQEARIRRRAALAVGRVGLREGVQPLVAV